MIRNWKIRELYLPVIEMNIRYLKPVFYGDTITVKTSITELPKINRFTHNVFNQNNKLINKANSTLVFVDPNTSANENA